MSQISAFVGETQFSTKASRKFTGSKVNPSEYIYIYISVCVCVLIPYI